MSQLSRDDSLLFRLQVPELADQARYVNRREFMEAQDGKHLEVGRVELRFCGIDQQVGRDQLLRDY